MTEPMNDTQALMTKLNAIHGEMQDLVKENRALLEHTRRALRASLNAVDAYRVVGGYSVGTTADLNPRSGKPSYFLILWPASDLRDFQECKVYEEAFREWRDFVQLDLSRVHFERGANPIAGTVTRTKAIEAGLVIPFPSAIAIGTAPGKETQMGTERRFSVVVESLPWSSAWMKDLQGKAQAKPQQQARPAAKPQQQAPAAPPPPPPDDMSAGFDAPPSPANGQPATDSAALGRTAFMQATTVNQLVHGLTLAFGDRNPLTDEQKFSQFVALTLPLNYTFSPGREKDKAVMWSAIRTYIDMVSAGSGKVDALDKATIVYKEGIDG